MINFRNTSIPITPYPIVNPYHLPILQPISYLYNFVNPLSYHPFNLCYQPIRPHCRSNISIWPGTNRNGTRGELFENQMLCGFVHYV